MSDNQKPDYTYWAKMDTWGLKDATLLLHDIEPMQFSGLNFLASDLPSNFYEMKKTYHILKKVPWETRYGYKKIYPPVTILREAISKDLSFPEALLAAVQARNPNEKIFDRVEKPTAKTNEQLSNRERRNLLRAIGLLVTLYIDEKNKPTLRRESFKPSASQLAQRLIEKAEYLGIETEGIKSVDRKITEALQLLEDETNPSRY